MGRPGSNAGLPMYATRRPDSEIGRPGSHMGRPGSDMGRPGSHMGRPGSDMGRPGSDMGRPGSHAGRQGEMGRPDSHAGRPDSNAGRPASTASRPTSRVSRAASESRRADAAPRQPQQGADVFSNDAASQQQEQQAAQREFQQYFQQVEGHVQTKQQYYGLQQRNIMGTGMADLITQRGPDPPMQQMDPAEQQRVEAEYNSRYNEWRQQYVHQVAEGFQQQQFHRQLTDQKPGRTGVAAGDLYGMQHQPAQLRADMNQSRGVSSMFHGPFDGPSTAELVPQREG